MNFEEIIELVKKQMPEVELGESKQFPVFIVKADQLHFLARFLKETPQLHMDFLICLTAAEGKKDDFNMIYILTSSEYMHKVMIKVPLSTEEEHPVVPTVSDLWSTAEFQEREVYDLFGIHFENHPDLRRLFLDEGWEGHPLRKDYKDPFILEN